MEHNSKKIIAKKPTLTIAIPAHNESRTIVNILQSILFQSFDVCVLEKIVIYCDGCSDNTVELIEDVQRRSDLVHYYNGEKRIGKTMMLNRIFEENQSDYLLVLDADIGLDSESFIQRFLTAAISDKKNVMFAAHQIPLQPKSFMGKIFHASFLMWDYVRLRVPQKDHVENFYGAATVYRGSFAKKIVIPQEIVGMRIFLYLTAKNNGGFAYIDDVAITYWPPHTVSDFLKLKRRVYGSDESAITEIFGDDAKNIYVISREHKVAGVMAFAKDHPFLVLPAVIIGMVLTRMTRRYQKKHKKATGLWDVALSTKEQIDVCTSKEHIVFSNYDDRKNPWYGGGGAHAIHEVAKRLCDKYVVTVVTGKFPGSIDECVDGVWYERIGSVCCGPKIGQVIYAMTLPFVLMRKKFIVWFESFTPPFSVGLLPLFTKKPVIGVVHMLAGRDMYRKYKIPFHWCERLGLKIYKRTIVPSEAVKQDVVACNKNVTCAIIPNGIDVVDAIAQKYTPKHILFLGRIEVDQKGLDLLLHAWNRIAMHTDLSLVIAGSGEKREEALLQNLIDHTIYKDRVTYVGRVDGEKKAQLIQESLCVVVSSRMETFSIVALESFAYGVPVVCFDLPYLQWIPSTCAIKARKIDAQHLAHALQTVMQDAHLRDAMSRAAREFARGYQWDHVAQKYRQYIENDLSEQQVCDEFIQKIIAEKTPVHFISPHLDDAALSCGGVITALSEKTSVTVHTVFTRSSEMPFTLSIKAFLRQCGVRDAAKLFAKRRREDRDAFRVFDNVLIRHWDFVDAQWRKKKTITRLVQWMAKVIPEFLYVYPIYRMHVISGRISVHDAHMMQEIEDRLRSIREQDENAIIFCPSGIGKHVDHVIVKKCCQNVFQKVILWSDFPYNIRKGNQHDVRSLMLNRCVYKNYDHKKKESLIRAYKTQCAAIFPQGDITNIDEEYRIMQNDHKTVDHDATSLMGSRWKRWIFSGAMLIFCVVCIVAIVKGNVGNPTQDTLLEPMWKTEGPFELSPERGRFALLYSMVENDSYQFSIPLARFSTPDIAINKDGQYVSLFMPGVSFIAIPGYLLGKHFGNAQVGAFVIIGLFAIMNYFLIYMIVVYLRRDHIVAYLAAFSFLFATPAFAYAGSFYQHHITVFCMLLAIYLMLRWRNAWALSAVWFLCVASVVVDNPNFFLMLPIGLFALGRIISFKKQDDRRWIVSIKTWYVVTFVTMVIPIAFFLLFNFRAYSDPFQLPGTLPDTSAIDENGVPSRPTVSDELSGNVVKDDEHEKTAVGFFQTRNLISGLYTHTLSPDRGIVSFAPVMLLGLFGIFLLFKKEWKIGNLIFGIILMDILLYSMWGDPYGGWAFGSRYLIPAYALFSIGIGVALHDRRSWWLVAFFSMLLLYSVGVNTLGAVTSNMNPPKVQVLHLEELSGYEQKYTYMRNWQNVLQNHSKSLVYRTWVHEKLSLVTYFLVLYVSIACVGLFMIMALMKKNRNDNIIE